MIESEEAAAVTVQQMVALALEVEVSVLLVHVTSELCLVGISPRRC